MIKSLDRYKSINSNGVNGKKVKHIVNIFTIFVLLSTLVMGSVASSWNVYGQSNETDSSSENVIQSIPQTSQEEIPESTNEQLTSKSGSSEDNSDISDNQSISGESNTPKGSSTSEPDGDCMFDPSLPKCAPDENGNCPEGFYMNGYEQCFPAHDGGCPVGYHSADDDETGRCIPNSEGCPSGMIFRPGMKTCGYKEDVCKTYPNLNDCKVDEDDNGGSNTSAYNSGFSHGCSDAKISDSSKRYINQPGKGSNYHTSEFMRGYNDGSDSCLGDNGSSSSPTAKGTFRVIVQITNQAPQDITGGITVSVDHNPEDIFKSAYGLYFPGGGETTSTTFTFKPSDVPVGTEFEVNLDYGDDYNQHTFGENSPVKRPEIVQFNIS